ncbi:MAG TPA: M3 family oligoendopeptidase, partial [Levilinea sp.]|nr:M3 family oligoendopeptidase [Levilinea sp.]
MTNPNATYTTSRWSLEDLYSGPGGSDLENAFKELDQMVSEFETVRDRLRDDIPEPEFMQILRQQEVMNYRAHQIYSYTNLFFSEDTQNQHAQTLMARVEQFLAELNNRELFFSLWWKALPDEAAQRLMENSGDLHYWLEEMRRFKPHTLSEPEEKIINIKNVTGSSAFQTLYDSITNRYVFKLEVDGEMREMTRGEIMVYARHPDADLRERAYQELYRVYGDDGSTLGQIYQTLVRDWRNEQIKLRNFETPLSVRNLANDISDDIVQTLLDVCRKNASVFQRFFKLKALWLGMDRLRRCDIYAPVVKSDKRFDFNHAVQMVFDSFRDFDPKLAGMAERVFAEQHLDSEVRKGKRGGAFCSTPVPDKTPWVLVNYNGRASDVSTLAHELGHAIHSMLAAHHSIFTYHASLPLAETASTFGEMMLVDRLLANETDESVRRDILFTQVDDSYASIMRQAFFALFERAAHEMIHNGASVDDLAAAYLQNLQGQFGDAVDLSAEFRWEWVSIPHIYHVPFYVYAYTFGKLLVLALYKQYQQEGEAFKPRFLKILSTGGAESPAKVLSG